MRILLADDSAINRDVALGQLQSLGYMAEVVNNGSEVLDALDFMEYDVVLMDCHMPEVDGFEATRKIREREQGLKKASAAPLYIIAMTASLAKEDKALCYAAGMNDFLIKPVSSSELGAALERAALSQALPADQLTERVTGVPWASPERLHADVDIIRLRELTSGKLDSLRRLIEKYLKDAGQMMEELSEAVREQKPDEIRRCAHKLGGTSATCGIKGMVAILQELEKNGKMGNASGCRALFTEAIAKFEQVQKFLAEHLQKMTTV